MANIKHKRAIFRRNINFIFIKKITVAKLKILNIRRSILRKVRTKVITNIMVEFIIFTFLKNFFI